MDVLPRLLAPVVVLVFKSSARSVEAEATSEGCEGRFLRKRHLVSLHPEPGHTERGRRHRTARSLGMLGLSRPYASNEKKTVARWPRAHQVH